MEFHIFQLGEGGAQPAQAVKSVDLPLEKNIQIVCEANLEQFFDITFLATEFPTGSGKDSGRIDTLGIDQRDNPVIIEYKLHSSENIINQALNYLDWLEDHKADFEILVQKKLGKYRSIRWTNPRIVCIAKEFSKNDRAIIKRQKNVGIDLVHYQAYENNLVGFEFTHKSQPTQLKKHSQQQATTPHEDSAMIIKLSGDWYIKGKNFHASGHFRNLREVSINKGGIRGQFVVAKGSIIHAKHTASYPAKLARERTKIIQEHDTQANNRVVITHDITFPSLNWAAGFVTGRRVSTWRTVKNKSGRTLKQVISQ